MPRPGPRPYECVRRTWHSDRHQPMRGSLIQEIFRVVNEIHSPATKKNKEWQEKLPIVVLKAEEILYSKANSETEYMDLHTLLDRTTDAINTIIRRDESTETGDLLHPCIEAALTLGCTSRRASRSQRNCSPQRYLNNGSQENANLPKETPALDQASLCPNSYQPKPHGFPDSNRLLVSDTAALCNNLGSKTQPQPLLKPYSVYPLYYGTNFPRAKSPHGNVKFLQDWSYKSGDFVGNPHSNADEPPEERDDGAEIECDLSLRLGPHSVQSLGVRGSTSPTRRNKLCGGRAEGDRDLSYISRMKNATPHKAGVQDHSGNSLKKRKLFYGPVSAEDRQQYNTFL